MKFWDVGLGLPRLPANSGTALLPGRPHSIGLMHPPSPLPAPHPQTPHIQSSLQPLQKQRLEAEGLELDHWWLKMASTTQ